MTHSSPLGEFLRGRRASAAPSSELGAGRRRVPGLRREEVARRAGVSPAYYTRLEQGRDRNASTSVLDALARALDLNEDERVHLADLARHPASSPPVPDETPREGAVRLVHALGDVPAVLLGYRTDVLAWNPAAHALLAPHLPVDAPQVTASRPNWARLVFCDDHVRRLYLDWDAKARDTVADLHLTRGRHPDDAGLARLTDDLARASPHFAQLWDDHPVANCSWHTREYDHPLVGRLTLSDELLPFPDNPGQRLVAYVAEPGSPSQQRLTELTRTSGQVAARHRSGT